MPILTNQQISNYYEQYKDVEVTFTKEVIRATGLLTKMIYLKGLGYQWPCIIYSCSMSGAKVIASITPEVYEQIREANNLVSLRFAFEDADKSDPVLFFVSAKVNGYNPYDKEKPNLNFVSLEFTKRPANDLIAILGQILDAATNSKKRSEERITLDVQTVKKLGLKNKGAKLFVQQVPRNCIVRDVSFSGAKVIIAGVAKFLIDKEVTLQLETVNNNVFSIKGESVRYEAVEGRKDLAAIAVKYHEDKVPMEYKMLINDYLKQLKKKHIPSGDTDKEQNKEHN
ncbi:MAG: PilZ domain-containing protein [Spirochaetia bacterium]